MEVLDEIEYVDTVDSTPHVGMEFDTLDEAWNFWVGYGGKIGFNTLKDFKNQKKDGPITSRWFVCSNEGYRKNDKRNREVKRPRAETRTGCPVCFSLKLIRQTQKYRVYDFYGEHNHVLQHREAVGLMPSQRKIPEPHGVTINLADDSGIRPREAYELMGQEAGGWANLPFTEEGCMMENSTQNSVSFKKKEDRKSGKSLENWVKKLTKAKKGKSANAKGQNENNDSENELQHQNLRNMDM